MKLGLVLPEAEYDMGGQIARWSDLSAIALLAEDIGFDAVWIVDHLLLRRGETVQGVWECWTMMAALAAVTRRVEIGSLVTPMSFRNPALLAKMADTVDEISDGRVILGLGAGWHEPEYRTFGVPFDRRVSRFEEALTITATLLRDGVVDFAGRFYTARDCELRPRGPRPRGLPIMLGSTSPRMLRLAARHADIWNAWIAGKRSHPDQIPVLRGLVDADCVEVGRDPATLQRSVSIMVTQTGTHEIGPSMKPEGAEPLTGSPEEIAEGLRGFEAEGIDHLQCYLVPNTIASVERFARVIEAFQYDSV